MIIANAAGKSARMEVKRMLWRFGDDDERFGDVDVYLFLLISGNSEKKWQKYTLG